MNGFNGRYATLVKREIWEHRSLWMAPLVVAGILLLLTILASVFASVHFDLRGPVIGSRGNMPMGATPMLMGVASLASQIFTVSCIVCGIYLFDCLYSERKDRSILFWKSLPVSDAETVLAKFAVGMVLVPLGVFVLSLVLFPVIYGIAALGIPAFSSITQGWSTAEWLKAETWMLLSLLVSLLWFAPVAAWAMLASVLSRRSPLMMGTLPFVVLGICESILLQSGHVWRFVGRRLLPVLDPWAGLQRPGLWIGLAVAAGMLYIVIRLRRYRDDT